MAQPRTALPATVRWAIAVDSAVGVAAVGVGAAVGGGSLAISIGLGFALVVIFLALSAWAVLAAERVAVQMTLPVAFTVYLTGMLLIGGVVALVGDGGYVRREPVGFAVLAAVLVWLVVQLVATVRLDPAPPFRRRRGE